MGLKSYAKKIFDSTSQKSYLTWFLHNGKHNTAFYKGIQIKKFPIDLFNYQEIIHERNVTLVIECGAYKGGATLFFSDMLQDNGFVLSIDNGSQGGLWDKKTERNNIITLNGDVLGEQAIATMKEHIGKTKGSVFLILDDLHTYDHIYEELVIFTPLLRKNDYLVIEDTRDRKDTLQGVKKYIKENPTYYTHDIISERKYGDTMAKFGFWIRN